MDEERLDLRGGVLGERDNNRLAAVSMMYGIFDVVRLGGREMPGAARTT